jgi:hypothetical protein
VEYTTADFLLQAVDEDTAGTDGDDESEEDEKGKDKRTETKEVSTVLKVLSNGAGGGWRVVSIDPF